MQPDDQLRILASGLRFPEGPIACPDGSVILVEIARGAVTRVAADGAASVVAMPGGGPNGLAAGPDGALYCCNNGGFLWTETDDHLRPVGTPPDYAGGWIERIDPVTGAVARLYDACGGHRLCGPNDIVFDTAGGFYFTDLGKSRPRDRDWGGVYYALPDGSHIVEVAHPVLTPNGVGLSPDGQALYVAETETSRLWAFDIEAPGRLRKQGWPSPHGGRLVCGLPGFQRFDSLAVLASGDVCVATLMTGCITQIAPDGRVVRTVPMPERYPTNLCFGGADGCTAFITLSGRGQLAVMRWPEPGLALNFALHA